MATDVSLAEEGDEQTRPGCPTPVEAQVESLAALPGGWYDDSSPAYDGPALRRANSTSFVFVSFALPTCAASAVVITWMRAKPSEHAPDGVENRRLASDRGVGTVGADASPNGVTFPRAYPRPLVADHAAAILPRVVVRGIDLGARVRRRGLFECDDRWGHHGRRIRHDDGRRWRECGRGLSGLGRYLRRQTRGRHIRRWRSQPLPGNESPAAGIHDVSLEQRLSE